MDTAKSLLRLTTSGSVDDGKSTLIGRLLFETNCIYEDHYAAIKKTSEKKGSDSVDLALLLDGLSAEREQGITIDVAYRYFETDHRKFIIADCPGHEQYTRNMVTGASTADLAIVLIDASKGVLTQSKRHGFLASLLKIPHMIVCVNKMDLVDWSQEVFESIVQEFKEFSEKMNLVHLDFIPVSALKGDNIIEASPNLPWYKGNDLLHKLENVNPSSSLNLVDFRYPVQSVIRPNPEFRGYAGRIASGTISPGEEVAILPSGKETKIKSIVTYDGELKEASGSQSVVLTLDDEIDISRGDMIVRKNNLPIVEKKFDALICWMDEKDMQPGTQYIIKHTSNETRAFITEIQYKIDINTLHRTEVEAFSLNDIGRVVIKTSHPLFFDSYQINRSTGSFILIDYDSNKTVAAGWIKGKIRSLDEIRTTAEKQTVSSNVLWQDLKISQEKRELRNRHKGAVFWLTGYSGAGKSTIAKALEKRLFETNFQTILLDGDNVRHGLCGDLGFTDEDRTENIRRVAEVANLFFQTGNICVCTFISPFNKDRKFARDLIPEDRFFEVFVKCDIEVCKNRDPKGLYKKALAGEIKDFTGISSAYEEPENPELIVETDKEDVESIVEKLMTTIKKNLSL